MKKVQSAFVFISVRHVSHVNNPYNEITLIRRESAVTLLGTIIALALFLINGY